MSEKGLSDRIEIVCAKGADYAFEEEAFDAATCIGASFVWGGYRPTICAKKISPIMTGSRGWNSPFLTPSRNRA